MNGNKMKDLNDSLLKLIGLNDEDRQILIKHIDRVINKDAVSKIHICSICVNKPINTVFLPCGHQAVCFECYEMNAVNFKRCSICRRRVNETVQTFMNGYNY